MLKIMSRRLCRTGKIKMESRKYNIKKLETQSRKSNIWPIRIPKTNKKHKARGGNY